MLKRKFSENEKLVIQHELATTERKLKEKELKEATTLVNNYENIQSRHPKEAWEALVEQLKKELSEIEHKLNSISAQLDKKHIDTSSSTFFSAKKTATKQRTVDSFFKNPPPINFTLKTTLEI